VPDPDGDERYAGAHLALSVASVKAYDEVYQKLLEQGVYLRVISVPRNAHLSIKASISPTRLGTGFS
jgi:hypothetical protein